MRKLFLSLFAVPLSLLSAAQVVVPAEVAPAPRVQATTAHLGDGKFRMWDGTIRVVQPPKANPAKRVVSKAGIPDEKFARGAKRSPPHVLVSAHRHTVTAAPPDRISMAVPRSQLSYWLNNQYGDCVTAEEAAAKSMWSVYCGLPDLMIPDAEVKRWASKHGILNGAMLTDTLDGLKKDPFVVNGVSCYNGGYSAVDYSSETLLQSALNVGPVKIAIDANALPGDAGNVMGWYAFGGSPGEFGNIDHCTNICGYGPAAWVFQQLATPLPAGVDPNKTIYMGFTWDTIGIFDHPWIMSTVAEAWVRNPTTVGQQPAPAPPPFSVTLTATPSNGPAPLTVTFDYAASAPTVTAWSMDFGDGSGTAAGKLPVSHEYKTAGTYTATLTTVPAATARATVTVGNVPPNPPQPPAPGTGVTGTWTEVWQDGKLMSRTFTPSTLPAPPAPSGISLEDELKAAGLDADQIATVRMIVNLLKAKPVNRKMPLWIKPRREWEPEIPLAA